MNPIGTALALVAVRVPPIQFTLKAGSPVRVVNTDILSGCGLLTLPAALTNILTLISKGEAFTIDSAMAAINSGIAGITAPLAGFIAAASGPLLTNLLSMQTALTGSGMVDLQEAIGGISTGVANGAGIISSLGNIATSLALPAFPSLDTVFGDIAGGSINTAIADSTTAVNNIVAAIQLAEVSGIGAIAGELVALTSALTTALPLDLTAVGVIADTLTGAINSAVANLANSVSSAGAILEGLLCPELGSFSTFINSIATPALKAVLPT